MMQKKKILFVCIHNSARSQMAEAWLNHLCGEFFEAHSAGLEPGILNPLVVEAMQEAGINISHKKTQSVFELRKKGILFSHVITVCDETSAERCPLFPGNGERLHWNFPDPSKLRGTKNEKLKKVREIRDRIKDQMEDWCFQMCLEKK